MNQTKYEAPQMWEMEVSVEQGFAATNVDNGKAGFEDLYLDQETEW